MVTGQSADDVVVLAAEIDAEKAKASEARAEISRLEAAHRTAQSYDEARKLEDALARARWQHEHSGGILPDLERRLQLAKAEHQAAALARHQAILRKRYPKFRAALLAAVEEQQAVMWEHDEAVKELGEHLVARHLPAIAYGGFLLKDLFAIWAAEQDRVFAEPLPKPAVVAPRPAPAPVPAKPVQAEKPTAVAAPSPPRPKRVPRRDPPPADSSQRQVTLMRPGIQLDDGTYGAIDVLTLPIAAAEALLKNGAADFTTTTTGVDS
jgi:hypothetical protein